LTLARASLTLALSALVGCGGGSATPDGGFDATGPDATPSGRELTFTIPHGEDGISEFISFVVPEGTRSLTIVVQGDETVLYALASLRTADGTEHIGLPLDRSYSLDLHQSYRVDQSGFAPGALAQTIRLGTFAVTFPNQPGQALPAGETRIAFFSETSVGQATVSILMPPDDGARILHVNVLSISETFAFQEPPLFLPHLQAIFAPANVDVVVEEVHAFAGTGLSSITEFTEPQERPLSPSANLARFGESHVDTNALNVFVVDSLSGAAGLSLGIQGPPLRVIGHFMGLWHPESRDGNGAIHPDPLDDTTAGSGNLMESTGGTTITPNQAYVLSRSPLLRTD
jgi:hypothetical protein